MSVAEERVSLLLAGRHRLLEVAGEQSHQELTQALLVHVLLEAGGIPRPAPVSTTARIALSSPSDRSESRSGTMTSNDIEFMRSGQLRVTTATSGRGRSIRT